MSPTAATGRYVYQFISDKFFTDGLHLLSAFGAFLVLALVENLFYGKILKGLLVCALGLSLVFGNDEVFFELSNCLVGIFLGFVKDTHLLSALKDDLTLFAFLSVDHLFVVGKLLLGTCKLFFEHLNDGFVGKLLFGGKGRFIHKKLFYCEF